MAKGTLADTPADDKASKKEKKAKGEKESAKKKGAADDDMSDLLEAIKGVFQFAHVAPLMCARTLFILLVCSCLVEV